MLVKCIANNVNSFDFSDESNHLKENIHLDEVDLILGKAYQVYGIAFRSGFPWFYVCEDDDIESLRLHFSGFFEIVSAEIPSGWKYCGSGHSESGVAFLPAKWAENPSLYEYMIDGDAHAINVFGEIKKDL